MKRTIDGAFKKKTPRKKPTPPLLFTEQQVLQMMRMLAQTLENRPTPLPSRVEIVRPTCPSYIT